MREEEPLAVDPELDLRRQLAARRLEGSGVALDDFAGPRGPRDVPVPADERREERPVGEPLPLGRILGERPELVPERGPPGESLPP